MNTQVKYSFDKASIKKIIKGALISASGTIALVLVAILGTVQFSNPTLTFLVAFIVPVLTNAIKEFVAGEPIEQIIKEMVAEAVASTPNTTITPAPNNTL